MACIAHWCHGIGWHGIVLELGNETFTISFTAVSPLVLHSSISTEYHVSFFGYARVCLAALGP